VTADEARKLSAFLERVDFFTTTQTTAALRKEAGTYQFCVPCAEDVYQDDEVLARCAVIGAGLSDEVFSGNAVEVHLWDRRLRTLAVVPHRGKFGERLRFNAAELFHTSGVSEGEAVRLGTYLMTKGFFNDGPKLGQLNRMPCGFELRLQVNSESELGAAHKAEFQRMACDLSRDVFRGVPVEVCPCGGVGKTLERQEPEGAPPAMRGPNRVFCGPMTCRIQGARGEPRS
jgi:hypothetical protein